MGHTAVPHQNTGDVIGATEWNTYLSDNDAYHFNGRPGQVIKRDNGATYTTTSASFVAIDGTNLSITKTINSGKVLISFCGVTTGSGAAAITFDIDIDGTRYGSAGTDGIAATQGSVAPLTVSFCIIADGLSVGSHTFKIMWKTSAGTASLYSGNGTGGADYIPAFSVEEIG